MCDLLFRSRSFLSLKSDLSDSAITEVVLYSLHHQNLNYFTSLVDLRHVVVNLIQGAPKCHVTTEEGNSLAQFGTKSSCRNVS